MKQAKKPTALGLQLILNGATQAEIARKAGVSIAYINRIVWGKDKPSAKARKAFVQATGLTEEILFGGGSKKAS